MLKFSFVQNHALVLSMKTKCCHLVVCVYFPGKYTQTVNCFYYIFMNNKKPTFRLLYADLDFTDCTSDYLTVYSGLTTKINAICNSQGQTEYTSTIMKIEYKGTTLSKYRGFHGIIITK